MHNLHVLDQPFGHNERAETPYRGCIRRQRDVTRAVSVVQRVSLPLEVCNYELRSEAATVESLQHQARIPSPRVFDWTCCSDP
ncbi:hypothetical protein BGZ63DRAFT_377514 [Mariannaea sp. PMI_226]|nr:hypothetical protein BGZ63DRAFT_377514 [Mariannaea sp. PMI_226]